MRRERINKEHTGRPQSAWRCFGYAGSPSSRRSDYITENGFVSGHSAWDRRLLLDLFTEFADHVAVPKILLGIKGRVEGRPTQPLAGEAMEIMVWVLGLAEFATAAVLIFRWRRWWWAWFLGLAAGLLLLFALYTHAPMWIGAVLGCGIFGGMLLLSRTGSAYPAEV